MTRKKGPRALKNTNLISDSTDINIPSNTNDKITLEQPIISSENFDEKLKRLKGRKKLFKNDEGENPLLIGTDPHCVWLKDISEARRNLLEKSKCLFSTVNDDLIIPSGKKKFNNIHENEEIAPPKVNMTNYLQSGRASSFFPPYRVDVIGQNIDGISRSEYSEYFGENLVCNVPEIQDNDNKSIQEGNVDKSMQNIDNGIKNDNMKNENFRKSSDVKNHSEEQCVVNNTKKDIQGYEMQRCAFLKNLSFSEKRDILKQNINFENDNIFIDKPHRKPSKNDKKNICEFRDGFLSVLRRDNRKLDNVIPENIKSIDDDRKKTFIDKNIIHSGFLKLYVNQSKSSGINLNTQSPSKSIYNSVLSDSEFLSSRYDVKDVLPKNLKINLNVLSHLITQFMTGKIDPSSELSEMRLKVAMLYGWKESPIPPTNKNSSIQESLNNNNNYILSIDKISILCASFLQVKIYQHYILPRKIYKLNKTANIIQSWWKVQLAHILKIRVLYRAANAVIIVNFFKRHLFIRILAVLKIQFFWKLRKCLYQSKYTCIEVIDEGPQESINLFETIDNKIDNIKCSCVKIHVRHQEKKKKKRVVDRPLSPVRQVYSSHHTIPCGIMEKAKSSEKVDNRQKGLKVVNSRQKFINKGQVLDKLPVDIDAMITSQIIRRRELRVKYSSVK